MHGAIFGQIPSYIRGLLISVSEMHGRTRLRSAAGLYDVSFTRTQFSVVLSWWLPLRSGTVFQSISDRFLTLDSLKER